jgi:site-specific DNA-methyltransferase (cytosine-N4-specific)
MSCEIEYDKNGISLINCDCREALKSIPDSSVDLIFTSPPYAERRKKSYNSLKIF